MKEPIMFTPLEETAFILVCYFAAVVLVLDLFVWRPF